MMLAITTNAAARITNPTMTGRLSVLMASTEILAQAVQAKHRLHDDNPAEQLAHVDTELGHDRGQSRPHAVPEYDPVFRQALGPGHPDVVLAEHVQQLATGQPGVDGGLHGGQGDPGQDHVPDPGADALRGRGVPVLDPVEAMLVERQEDDEQQQLTDDERGQ